MKVIDPGHRYELDSMDGTNPQTIDFIKKEKAEDKDGNATFKTVQDGTTNEDVLAVLIDRMETLDARCPCHENKQAISNLNQALAWLHKRTQVRVMRGVEGTPKP